MLGREELDVNKLVYATDIDTMLVDCEGTEVWPQDGDGNEYYFKTQADNVMDAMEARIKELEHQVMTDCTCDSSKSATLRMDLYKAQERIKELEATISILETTQKWISVEDELPKEGEEALVFYTSWKHEYQQVAMFESGEFIDIGGCALSPTHWMPLPPPPTTEEK